LEELSWTGSESLFGLNQVGRIDSSKTFIFLQEAKMIPLDAEAPRTYKKHFKGILMVF
jgi:hypothetical protein